jgi:hypothetical protein
VLLLAGWAISLWLVVASYDILGMINTEAVAATTTTTTMTMTMTMTTHGQRFGVTTMIAMHLLRSKAAV